MACESVICQPSLHSKYIKPEYTEIKKKTVINRWLLILCLKQYIRGSLNKFPDFFRMGTFIDSTLMKL